MLEKLISAGFTEVQARALTECFTASEVETPFAKYFTEAEFACKCGGVHCNGFPVKPDKKLVALLDDIREAGGAPCIISSAVRCDRHNAAVGGVANSYHKRGRAADFMLCGKNAAETVAYCKRFVGRYVELYEIDVTYVHIAV